MKQRIKRLCIVVGMVLGGLIVASLLDTSPASSSDSNTQTIAPIPVENNVSTPADNMWEQRLNNVVQIYSKDKNGKMLSVGTGWFIKDHPGLIMTDEHVIDSKTTSLQINLKDGRTYITNNVIWSSKKDDLAKVQLQTDDDLPSGFSICTAPMQVADDVWLIGNPFDMPWSVHKGIVASTNRSNVPQFKRMGYDSDYAEIDIVMEPGMSGGPFITKDGCVIGIASFLYSMPVDNSSALALSFATKNTVLLKALAAK